MSSPKSASRSVYIDNTSAELALDKLTRKMKALEDEINKGTLSGDRLNKKIKELETTKQSIQSVQDQISKGLRPTFVQVENQVRQLRNELKRMSEDAPGYAAKFESFKNATAELNRMQTAISGVDKAQRSWMQEARTVAFGVLIGNTVQSALQAITSYLGGIVSGNAKLSDSLADVEKATGLTSAEVQQLNSQLGKIDTRTATADLREIATGLGQVGEQADSLNVENIDKIVVALGDEFGGGAREITTVLSVLRNNLTDIKTGNYGDDVIKIGNALNTLGAEGLATAPVVTDIANRIAGISQTYGVTSGQILGLAATFQELGIETERGSTAITKLFQKIGAEPEKFAKITKLSAAEFKDLVNRDMVGAFQLVAEGAQRAGSNNVVFSQILKELDADGSGAGEVLSKLGGNAELLAKKVDTATTALTSSDSILDEFNKKNNTLGAELDKLNKSISSLIQSKTLSDFFASAVRGLSAFIDALKAAPEWIKENQTGLYLIVAGIAILNASYIKAGVLIVRDTAIKLINAATTRGTAIATNLATAAQAAYIIITNLLTARITLATAAQRLWNTALSLGAGPIGVIVIAVGALIIGINNLVGATKKLTAEQQVNADVQKQIAESIGAQEQKSRDLLAIAKNLTLDYTTRKQALDEVKKSSDGYLESLTLENINTQQSINLIDEYIDGINRLSKAKVLASLKDKLNEERIQQDIDLQLKKQKSDAQGSFAGTLKGIFGTSDFEAYTDALNENVDATSKWVIVNDQINESISKLNFDISVQENQLKKLTKGTDEYSAAERKLNNLVKERNTYLGLPTATGVNPITPGTAAVNPFASDDEAKKLQKQREDYLKLRADIINDINEASRQGLDLALYKIFQERAIQEKKINDFFKNGVINSKERDESLLDLQRETEAKVRKVIADINDKVKAEPIRVEVMPEVKEEDIDAVREALRQAFDSLDKGEQDRIAARSLVLLKGTAKQKLDAQLEILDEERRQELQNKTLTENQKLLIEAQYREKVKDARRQFLQDEAEVIEEVLSFAGAAVDILSKFDQARSNKENAQLDRELKANDVKKAAYQKQLDGKLISQQQYQQNVDQLDKQAQAKKDAIEAEQNKRRKKLAIAQALINGAVGVTKAAAEYPWPFSLIPIAFTIATTAAEIATISSTKYEKGGAFLKGDSHASGGMPVINRKTGKVEAEMEGGEVILSKKTVANNWDYINPLLHTSMHQGGRRITPWWQSRSYQAINYPVVQTSFVKQRMYATGGVFNSNSTATPAAAHPNDEMKDLMKAMLYRLENPVPPVIDNLQVDVPLKKIDDARNQQNRIQNDAVLR